MIKKSKANSKSKSPITKEHKIIHQDLCNLALLR